ncbi:MFS transporter [Ancrocorticia populi]|uniref:MFS transporter n=1 Tax=Ancrocorticia populi TaxID=2175228 RepID=A0A2V1KFJ9_9ACTO|nr:MFS transporter [Ancrocorticia populi]PWF27584.1 MFS transporter [Ancrocorticia populi]
MSETTETAQRGEPTGTQVSDATPELPSPKERLWANKRYVTWLVSDTSKGLAGTLLNFAIPLLTLMVTNDPAQAGIIGGVGLAVQIVCTLSGGVLADRHSRIRLMVLGGLSGAIISAGFAAIAWLGNLTFTTLLVIEVLLAIRGGIFNSAGEAKLKSIVPAEALGRAQAANQGRDAALMIAGNPIGGFLLAIGGWMVGVAMCVAHLIAASTAWVLGRMGDLVASSKLQHNTESPTAKSSEHIVGCTAQDPDDASASSNAHASDSLPTPAKTGAFGEMKEAFAWLFSRPDLRNAMLIATIINLGQNAAITTAIYVLQQSGHTPVQIGTVSSTMGIVMLIGALIAPFLVQRVGAGILVAGGLVLLTVGVGGLTVAHSIAGIAVLLAASTVLTPALNSGLLGYFMVAVPTEMLGRATSAIGVLAMGAMPIAPLVAGFGLAWIGRTGTILLCAALCATSAAIALFSPSVRKIPKESGWTEHAERYE